MIRVVRIFFLGMILMALFGCSNSSKKMPPGLQDGALAKCPKSPNCVNTYSADEGRRMPSLPFYSDLETSRERILSILRTLERVDIVTIEENYIHAEFTSNLFKFVDDVEFAFDDVKKTVHFRSASRTGYSDLGVNRNRMQKITDAYLGKV